MAVVVVEMVVAVVVVGSHDKELDDLIPIPQSNH